MSKTPKPISAKEFGKLYDAAEKRRASAPAPKKVEHEDIGMAEAKRRAREAAARGKRIAWLKRLGILGLVATVVWGWFGRIKTDKNNEKTNVVVHQWLVDNQNTAPDFYEYEEPVYHPQNGRVSFEVPLPDEHPVSSPIKTGYHQLNAGARDVLGDVTATLDSVAGLAYAGADARRGIESWKSVGVEGRAHRSKVREDRKRDRLRTESRELGNERTRQNLELQRQRAAERKAERLCRIQEKERKRLERERKAAQREAQKRADKARREASKYAKGKGSR